jgi:transposase
MEASREAIIDLFKDGKSTSQIVKILSHLNISRVLVWRVIKHFKETGTCPRSGRPRSQRTPEAIKTISDKIQQKTGKSIRQIAKESNMSNNTVRRIIKEDLTKVRFLKVLLIESICE